MADYTKNPHNRAGFSGPGRTDAREIDRSDVAFLTRRRPGVVAKKKGDFLYVTRTEQALGRFYALGRVDSDWHAIGSTTAKGAFIDTGAYVATGAQTSVNGRVLLARGDDQLQTAAWDLAGTVTNFEGEAMAAYALTLRKGRRPSELEDFVQVQNMAPHDGGGVGYQTSYAVSPGAWNNPGAGPVFTCTTACVTRGAGGQYEITTLVETDGVVVTGEPVVVENQIALPPELLRLGPSHLLMVARYVRPWYGGSTVDVDATPGIVYHVSADNGLTWAPVSSDEILSEFNDTKGETDNDTEFNSMVNAHVMVAAPVSGTRCILYALVPYWDADAPEDESKLRAKVKLGTLDLSMGAAMFGTLTLFDGEMSKAQRFHAGSNSDFGVPLSALGLEGGALIQCCPITGDSDEHEQPRELRFTPDGVEVQTIGPMPFASYLTGAVMALSPTTIVCPVHDEGAYRLLQSDDRGATWRRRAVLAEGEAPSPSYSQMSLDDFSYLSVLRQINDSMARSLPGTPWAVDSRLAAPT